VGRRIGCQDVTHRQDIEVSDIDHHVQAKDGQDSPQQGPRHCLLSVFDLASQLSMTTFAQPLKATIPASKAALNALEPGATAALG